MQRKTIAETLQAEIAKVGSIKRVARETGLGYATVHRFATQDAELRLPAVQSLADYFGLELTKRETAKTPPKKPATKSAKSVATKRKETAATKKRTTKKRTR